MKDFRINFLVMNLSKLLVSHNFFPQLPLSHRSFSKLLVSHKSFQNYF